MAAGKTTVGRKLAKMLGVPFIDLDAVIEEAAQMTIPEIFANEGEAGFRKRERLALLAKPDKGVIATGGGIVTVPENRCFSKEAACSLSAGRSFGVEKAHRPNSGDKAPCRS